MPFFEIIFSKSGDTIQANEQFYIKITYFAKINYQLTIQYP